MVSIRVLQAIGPAVCAGMDQRFGFDPDKHPAYLTMALGAGSVTPLQMATAYSVFANGGYRWQSAIDRPHHRQQGPVLPKPRPPRLDEIRCARSMRATPS
jgi:penicillin-binding protein 1A